MLLRARCSTPLKVDGSNARSPRCSVAILALSICALAAFAANTAAAATRVEQGQFCTEVGGEGGKCNTTTGVAVNRIGAGSVSANDVYVADKGNNRVQEFSAEGIFVRAFGVNVVRTGPDNSMANSEVQTITVKGDSGSFTLSFTFNGGTQTTAAIKYNATASEVESALQALSNVGTIGGTITVSGGPGDATGSNPYTLTFGGALAGTDVSQITIDSSRLGTAIGTVLTCAGGPASGVSLAYQWLSGGSPATGPGATTTSYTTVPADAGKVVQCRVKATTSTGSSPTGPTAAIQTSNPATVMSPSPGAVPVPPSSITAPAAPVGGFVAGKKLICTTGTWTGATSPFVFQWYRNGEALSGNGAETNEYTLQAGDLTTAAAFQCAVTGSNAAGAVTKVSANRVTASPAPVPSPAAPATTASVIAPTSSTGTSINGVDAFEVCVAAAGDICQAGIASGISGSINAPQAIAIDQANGNIYLVSDQNKRVDVFSAKGAFEGSFGWAVSASSPAEELQFCVTSCQAGKATPLAGGFSNLLHVGVAINPSNGHVLVGDRGNLRVNEFNPTLNGSNEVTAVSFLRAIGGDVLSGGAEGTGTLTAGEKVITSIKTTSKTFVAGQSISGTGIPPGTTITAVSVSFVAGLNSLTLSNPVEAGKSGTNVALLSASAAGSVPRNEKQSLSVAATGGTFKLNFGTTLPSEEKVTGALPFNASAIEVQTALAGLSNIGPGNVEVTGSSGNYLVEFKGTRFADTNVSQLVVETGTLTGGSASVTTTTEGTSPEVCTVATGCQVGSGGAQVDTCNGTGCRPSTAGGGVGFFTKETPGGLAVDSSGNIYAATAAGGEATPVRACASTNPCRIQKFNPDGSFKEVFGPTSGGASECQLAWSEGIDNAEAPVGLQIDPSNQHVFVTRKASASTFESCEFDGTGVLKDRSPVSPLATNTTGYLTPALSTTEDIYVNAPISGAQSTVYILGPSPKTEKPEMRPCSVFATTSLTLNGKVTVPAPGGPGFNTVYHFEYSSDKGDTWTSIPVPDKTKGSIAGTFDVSEVVEGLQPNLTYRIRLVATTGESLKSSEVTCKTLGSAPSISHTQAIPVTEKTAKLNADINSNNSPTTYHFEWGESTAYGNQAPDFEPFTGSDGQPVPVSANITDLKISTEYHFRIVASNAFGTTIGPDSTFTTNSFPKICANELIRKEQNALFLPDCRAYEQVSPNDKRPVGLVRIFFGAQLPFQASSDGSQMYFPVLNGLLSSTAGGDIGYLGSRQPSGWASNQLSPPALVHPAESSVGVNRTGRILFNSPDLSCTVLESNQPLTADTPQADVENGVFNLYKKNADGSYSLLTAPVPLNASTAEVEHYSVDWATPDCSHVLFDSDYILLPGASIGSHVIYEWSNATLRIADILPDGSVPSTAKAGGGSLSGTPINSISSDGSKVFFTAKSNSGIDSGKTAIFVRKSGVTTLNISRSSNPNGAAAGVEFQGATPSGSHVFFLAKYGLAPSSSKGPSSCTPAAADSVVAGEGCDLYDYNVGTETLTDLSVDSNLADAKGAGVVGMVDASDNGEYVYFAARGQLIVGQGQTQAENLASGSSYNIYLNHNGQFSFVGVMTGVDGTNKGGGSNLASNFNLWAADATPSGARLLFVSRSNVTGYVSGGVTEAYLYSAASNSTTCISCRSDGLSSVGKSTTVPIEYKETLGWDPGVRVVHRPRALSDDGQRVIFTMPDVLASGAVSGGENIYEWENGKVYLLAPGNGGGINTDIRYADSSASGNDVFLVSSSKLALQDFDSTPDLYDVRIGGGFTYTQLETPCDVLLDQCAPAVSNSENFNGSIESEVSSGGGNQTIPKPRLRHKKKHSHKKKKHTRHIGSMRGASR